MDGRVFETFQKFFFSKFQKCPKSFSKVSKRVLNVFWGKFFEFFFAQCSVEGRVFENFLKNQKILKILKCPKSFPKVSKHVLNMFWGKLFEKFLPSFPWKVETSKIFKKKNSKFQKMHKSVPKSIQTCFRVIFSKKIYARCCMEGRVFENFQNFFFQNSKNAQNPSRKYPSGF